MGIFYICWYKERFVGIHLYHSLSWNCNSCFMSSYEVSWKTPITPDCHGLLSWGVQVAMVTAAHVITFSVWNEESLSNSGGIWFDKGNENCLPIYGATMNHGLHSNSPRLHPTLYRQYHHHWCCLRKHFNTDVQLGAVWMFGMAII